MCSKNIQLTSDCGSWANTSDEEFVLLLRRFGGGFRTSPRAQNIQANFDPLYQSGCCVHRPPERPPHLRASIFDGFERARQNAIHANQLPAQTVRSFLDDAIQSLGLAAREINDVRSVVNEGGDLRLRVFQKDLGTRENGSHARVQIVHHAVDGFRGPLQLQEKCDQDANLNDERNRCNNTEEFHPELHTHPALSAPSAGNPLGTATRPSGLRFAQESFAPGVNGRRNRIALASGNILAALDQVVGAITQFLRLLLGKFAAFVGAFRQIIPCLFAGLGSKEHPQQSSYAETYEKIGNLGTHVVSHGNLQGKRSIGEEVPQHVVTCIAMLNG